VQKEKAIAVGCPWNQTGILNTGLT